MEGDAGEVESGGSQGLEGGGSWRSRRCLVWSLAIV